MSLDCDDSCVEIYIKRDGKAIDGDFVMAGFARQLERELINAKDELDSIINVIPSDAPCLHYETGDHIADYVLGLQKEVRDAHALYFNILAQNAVMREVIKAAHDALEESAAKLAGWHGLYETQIGSDDYAAVLNAESVIAKLKHYLP